MRQLLIATLMGLALLAATPQQGHADTFGVFDLTWSGTAYGNSASATGTITLDLSLLNNPGTTFQDVTPFVTNFTTTVTGASSGNGFFTLADYNGSSTAGGFYLDTGGGALDFGTQLIGQSTPGGPWGSTHDGNTGDFNIFANGNNPFAPNGTFFFQTTTNEGFGDSMNLTSFAPATNVPEPSTVALESVGLIAVFLVFRRRQTV